MLQYICALPDIKGRGRAYHLITGNAAAVEVFARKHDRPGYGVYSCVSRLKPGARRRTLDEVAETDIVHVDIDARALATPAEAILETLIGLPLPLQIRFSGGGFHVLALLKEPVEADTDEFARVNELRTKLTTLLCGDSAPNHAAALLRQLGTHNSKYEGEARLCHVMREGSPVDITEVEALVDLYEQPLFEFKPKSNGHAPETGTASFGVPIDIEARLAAMQFQGGGDTCIHTTQLAVTASLLRNGVTVDGAVDEVLEATRRAVADDPRAAGWDWDAEKRAIEGMAFDFINNRHPELCELLPDHLLQKWRERQAAGQEHVRVQWTAFAKKWAVSGRQPRGAATADDSAAAGNTTPKGRGGRNSGDDDSIRDSLAPKLPLPGSAAPRTKIRAISFDVNFNEAALKPRAHLYARHYQRGQCTATIGCDGAGKSTVGIGEGVAMATCRNLLGEQPEERCRVWLHNADDDSDEMYRRIAAFCRLHNIPTAELHGWLFVTGKNNFRVRIASGNGTLTLDRASIGEITETIIENKIDVAVFDPLVAMHAVAENDNVKMSEVIHIFGDIAARCDCAIDLCHHTRKPSAGTDEKEFNSDDSRGASAVRAAVRASRVFNRMSKAEAEKAGIEEESRVWFIRIDRGKANYLPPAAKATWFELKSIPLLNGEQVGAIAPWTFPGQDGAPTEAKAAADRVAEELFLNLLARLTLSGINVTATNSRSGAPQVFARQPEARVAKVGSKAFEGAMDRLIKADRIYVEQGGRKGKETRYIRAK